MRFSNQVLVAVSTVLLVAGSAFADKQDEITSQERKPWFILDLPEFANTRADVNETEPVNNACPGEAYTLGDIYHAGIIPAGDNDWITFQCNQGDLITVGTDADGALPTVDTVIHLMAADCTTELTSNDDGGPGLYSLISNFPAPYTGSYNVRVRGFSATSTGNYILLANCTIPPDTICPIDMYKSFKFDQVVSIPDNNPAGIVYGPILVPEDLTTIDDLVVDLGISHTWVGDLVVTLTHIPLAGPAQSIDLIQRPGVPATSVGCSGNLVGSANDKYYFGTGNLTVLGETSCPTTIPVQCYAVAPENPDGLLLFRGTLKAGEWFLTVSDNAALDVGTLYNFSVHFLNHEPISVDASSWGMIKANYR